MAEVVGVKLTTPQEIVLRRLVREAMPLSGPELSDMTRNCREWATPRLKQLEKKGLVIALGETFSGARCYMATEAGVALMSRAVSP